MNKRKKEQELLHGGDIGLIDINRSPFEQTDVLPFNDSYHISKNSIIFGK